MRKLSQYITDQNFQCRCGCGRTQPQGIELIIPEYTDIQHILFGVYDLIRGRWNARITSGYRCRQQNAVVGGAVYSPHLWGVAIDFVLQDIKHNDEVVDYLKSLGVRIGHLKYQGKTNHIHIDLAHKIADALFQAQWIPQRVRDVYKTFMEW